MQYTSVKLTFILLLELGLTGLQAQEAIPANGGNASGSGGSVSYSIGQVAYTTILGTNGSVAQGIQQPYEISVVTELQSANGITLQSSAYPNPATNYIKLKVEIYKTGDLTYQIYDNKGILLENKEVESNETSIPMEDLKPAMYFLKLIQNGKEVKTFKIIKN